MNDVERVPRRAETLELRLDIHLDPLGGWAGDMFAAAILDAFPAFWPNVEAAVGALGLGPDAAISLVPDRDHALTGRRFLVAAESLAPLEGAARHHHHHHHHDDHHHEVPHAHRAWRDIRALIGAADLRPGAREHALAIFALLARAEAEVHGVAEEDVTFHEVGAVDSIVDIVVAGTLIAMLDAARWSSAALPLGSGRVRTQHGLLPVPTPATALLLAGLPTLDDGVAGERITPTGAAIARHLLLDAPAVAPRPRRLMRIGTGFGTRTLPGLSNCLRVLAFEPVGEGAVPAGLGHRELAVVEFEVDDQSAEDLAHGLDHIRALAGVHDVIQGSVFGKRGRIATHVRVLAVPEALEATIAACFTETATIGLRHHIVQGAMLRRVETQAEVDGRAVRVKIVERPGGLRTAKAEAVDVAADANQAARTALRRRAEAQALDAKRDR